DSVQTHLEPLTEPSAGREVPDDKRTIERIVRQATGRDPREVRFLRTDGGLVAFLTLGLEGTSRLEDAHARASEIEERIRRERAHRAVKPVMFSPAGMDLERGWPGRVDGETVVQLAAQTLQVFFAVGGALREHASSPLAEVDLRAPVLHPPSIRLFGDGVDFVFGNTAAVFGPDEELRYPEGSTQLRSRPAVAAVIGADGAIGGFTAANACAAPDLTGDT